ncbi:MAG: hypothetical protein CMJ46_15500, partial [Planctomyces sp.]|nr:hypothetical protein [Planctomyces sp.]
KFLIDFVVEQTGYPAEMVELDADLEADLGIDSIKKAQMFGEIAEQVVLDVEIQLSADMSLDDFPTLRSIIEFITTPNPAAANSAPAASAAAAPVAAPVAAAPAAPAPVAPAPVAPAPVAPAPVAVRPVMPAPVQPAAVAPVAPKPVQVAAPVSAPAPAPMAQPAVSASAGSAASSSATATSTVQKKKLTPAELEQFLIDFVVEQTGYPAEMVELDADLEADLGIDSIKKAQMFGEIAEQVELDVEIELSADMSLDDFPTLRSIIQFISKS